MSASTSPNNNNILNNSNSLRSNPFEYISNLQSDNEDGGSQSDSSHQSNGLSAEEVIDQLDDDLFHMDDTQHAVLDDELFFGPPHIDRSFNGDRADDDDDDHDEEYDYEENFTALGSMLQRAALRSDSLQQSIQSNRRSSESLQSGSVTRTTPTISTENGSSLDSISQALSNSNRTSQQGIDNVDTVVERDNANSNNNTAQLQMIQLETDTDQDLIQPSSRFTDLILADSKEVTWQDHYQDGRDVQGINWSVLPITRQRYRDYRNKNYTNHTTLNNHHSHSDLISQLSPCKDDGKFYRFHYTRLMEKSFIIHFQLRHLASSPSKHELYFSQHWTVRKWNAITRSSVQVVDFHAQDFDGANLFRITSLCSRQDLLAVGGFSGEVCFLNTGQGDGQGSFPSALVNGDDEQQKVHCVKVSQDPYGITNHVAIDHSVSGRRIIIASNNDQYARIVDVEYHKVDQEFQMPWAVNCSALDPDSRRILACVGDSSAGWLLDPLSGDKIAQVGGFLDYSFCCAWSPNGIQLAVGNQDKTVRIFDKRRLDVALKVLPARMAAIRSCQYSPCGNFLMAAEPADYVHLYDVKQNYKRQQIIDFFGEISGCTFADSSGGSDNKQSYDVGNDDGDLNHQDGGGGNLFIVNADTIYGGIYQYKAIKYQDYVQNRY
ncbi:hypothetical protein MIR68_004535 [Amoeboaphelidium protococcarum]|nr:hypothetical protein MIR68_004535 [Amoeboaphelidium protococcarum]